MEEKEKSKVYCKECKYISPIHTCEHKSSYRYRDIYYEKEYVNNVNCSEKNTKNDCPDFVKCFLLNQSELKGLYVFLGILSFAVLFGCFIYFTGIGK